MLGNILFVFSHTKLTEISNIDHDSVKCGGLLKRLPNIGGVAIRMEIYGHSFCFLNCFLPKGRKNMKNIFSVLKDIH